MPSELLSNVISKSSASDTIAPQSVAADYKNEVTSLKNYIIAIPVILISSYFFYLLADAKTIIAWGKEDSFFEWLTAFFYFTGGALLLKTFKKTKNIFLLLLAIVLLFGACEEISWGQRIFGFTTPEEINKINVQHEFNIHNMVLFDGKKMEGGNKEGLDRILNLDMWFKIFNICFGFVLPLCVYHFKSISALTRKFKIPVPPICIGVFFIISWICFKLSLEGIPAVADRRVYWRIFMAGPEIAEFVSSFILATLCLYFYMNRNKDIMGKDFKQLTTKL